MARTTKIKVGSKVQVVPPDSDPFTGKVETILDINNPMNKRTVYFVKADDDGFIYDCTGAAVILL